ncbi:DinB family protein [Spirosoma areae]
MEIAETGIQRRLLTDSEVFVKAVNHLTDEQFRYQPDGKWSVAEVMQHLYLSARPVARLMSGTREVLKQWGKPDGPARTYEEMAAIYQKVLGTGVKAPATMSPRPEDVQVAKNEVIERFTSVYQALVVAVDNWPEDELTQYVIPHPALGKLSVREMLHFVSIHTQHHLRLLPEMYR